MFFAAIMLALGLIAFGVGTALRQRRTWKRLRDERFIPSDERDYLRGQVRRRLMTSATVALIGGMIAWSYLSGMEARATEIAERSRWVKMIQPGEPNPPTEDEKEFIRQYGYFWMAVLVLVFLAAMCAVFDFWATRWYWMAQYRIIKADHEAKLQRDLAVYRQAKDNDRMTGLGNGKPDDEYPKTS